MYDGGKIVAGLAIALALFGLPFFWNAGRAVAAPEPELDTPVIAALPQKQCVESLDYMRRDHMQLLRYWRESVVRHDARIYVSSGGKEYEMSLQNTCMNCHSNKHEFCDACHDYMSVDIYCWDCHVAPEERP
jgi:hypothetical protein